MKIEIKKVDNERGIVQITTLDERWYQIGEKFVPSVSWIAGYYPKGIRFYKWLAEKGWDEAEAIKQAAGNRGSKVHQAVEQILLGEEVKINAKFTNYETDEAEELEPNEYACVMSFVDWLNEANPEILGIEYVVVNEKEGYAGTVDLKCRIGGKVYIVDLKTSQSIWPEQELQISAYKHADKDIDAVAILQVGYRLNKRNFKFTEIEDKFSLFLSAKQIWAAENEGVEPKQKDYPVSLSWKELKKKPAPKTKKTKVKVKTKKTK